MLAKHYHRPTPTPRQSELGLMTIFGSVPLGLDRDLGWDRWVLYLFNTNLSTISFISIVTFSKELRIPVEDPCLLDTALVWASA